MSADEQRKLAAIMFTDMVGYSALSQRDEKLAQELLEEHRRLLREIFPRFNGTEIKNIGDAFLVEFGSALEAAQCAIEIQRALAKRNADAPAERQIEIRIGIHIGDVVHRGGDVYGDGVNIASRIEQLANAGGICVSMDVERQIRNALEARFEKLAPTELKNISVPMDLFRIVLPWEQRAPSVVKSPPKSKPTSRKFAYSATALALLLIIGIGWWWTTQSHRNATSAAAPSTAHAANQKSIAVLPFDNLSRDPDNAFFTEGVQEEILTRLAKVADLKVIARTSTQRFKSAPADLRDVGQQLGVTNILEGSVQKANDQVRVNVQLINVMTNAHLWAEIYDRKLTDIFAVESEIAKTVADTLQAKLSGSEKVALTTKPTENPEAHELYLKGRYFWNRRTTENIRKAIDYFQQAIGKDPAYALAYAGLGDAHAILPIYASTAPNEDVPAALAAARKAVELDDSLAEAHTSFANALLFNVQLAEAEPEFRRALELNPNYATAHQWYGECPQGEGRFAEAVAELQRAQELDPLSLIINASYGCALGEAGRPDEGVAQLHKTLEMDPTFWVAHEILGGILEGKGDLTGATAEYEKSMQRYWTPNGAVRLASVNARLGKKAEARKTLDDLTIQSRQHWVSPYALAVIHLALDEKEEALRLLEKSLDERAIFLQGDYGSLKTDKRLNSLRGDPRFQKLVERFLAAKPE
jgi:adenylate cyclase